MNKYEDAARAFMTRHFPYTENERVDVVLEKHIADAFRWYEGKYLAEALTAAVMMDKETCETCATCPCSFIVAVSTACAASPGFFIPIDQKSFGCIYHKEREVPKMHHLKPCSHYPGWEIDEEKQKEENAARAIKKMEKEGKK